MTDEKNQFEVKTEMEKMDKIMINLRELFKSFSTYDYNSIINESDPKIN